MKINILLHVLKVVIRRFNFDSHEKIKEVLDEIIPNKNLSDYIDCEHKDIEEELEYYIPTIHDLSDSRKEIIINRIKGKLKEDYTIREINAYFIETFDGSINLENTLEDEDEIQMNLF